jgi:geranylgeranyl diphosphate synthase type I
MPPAALFQHLPLVESALRAALEDGPTDLVGVSRYVMGWEDSEGLPVAAGGKRIRPALCVFGATLFGAQPEVALPGAVAVELIHNFSLVHDEVQDHDAQRHHRPTVWALMGEGQAINVGDFLITRALAAVLESNAPSERRLRTLRILNEAMARMIAGQWADISFEARADVTTDEYLAMVRGKTGALLGAPLAMGATLAGASTEQAIALQQWGETVGLAFQVRDDVLGIWGNPNLTGKSNTNDIARKKKTLPIIIGRQRGADTVIARAYAREELSPADIAAVVHALESVGAAGRATAEADRLIASAGEQLASFELPAPARESLRQIGEYLVNRDN